MRRKYWSRKGYAPSKWKFTWLLYTNHNQITILLFCTWDASQHCQEVESGLWPPDSARRHSPLSTCFLQYDRYYPMSFLNCFRGLLHKQKTYLRISFSCLSSPLRQSPSLASCKFCSFNCPTSVSSCAIFSSFLILKVQLWRFNELFSPSPNA